MTNKVMLAFIALIAVLLTVDVFGRTESWAYDIVSPTDSDLGSKLTQMGLDGYELVFARRASDATEQTSTARYEMIFKRRLGFFEAALAKQRKVEGEAEVQKQLRQLEMQRKKQ
jgi:hypothetical protein